MTSSPSTRTPGQSGSRERGFGSLKYERLFLEEIDDVLDLIAHAERYRVDYNTRRREQPRTSAWCWYHEGSRGRHRRLHPA